MSLSRSTQDVAHRIASNRLFQGTVQGMHLLLMMRVATHIPDVLEWQPIQDVFFDVMMLDTIVCGSLLSAIIGFLCVSTVTTVLDCFPTVFLRFKTQGERSRFTIREWVEAFSVSMMNLLCTSWVCLIPASWMRRVLHDNGPFSDRTLLVTDPFDWRTEILRFVACFLIVDVWFYLTHRALHSRLLYARVHKVHHRFKAPTAVAAMYAHPLEYGIGNLGGVAAGIVLTNCHPLTAFAWTGFGVVSSTFGHSGYSFFGAQNHDFHHQYFSYNFGVGGGMDWLCGTGFIGSSTWKSLQRGKYEDKISVIET
jgi:sterol desaturase/sphingolipid hydroxylase (fatty acid hydroxylase superfamily)